MTGQPEILDSETIRWDGRLWHLAADLDAPATDPVNWTCQIGEVPRDSIPDDSDGPMRAAVARAYRELTGRDDDFLFSGWGDPLPERYRAAVENRLPR